MQSTERKKREGNWYQFCAAFAAIWFWKAKIVKRWPKLETFPFEMLAAFMTVYYTQELEEYGHQIQDAVVGGPRPKESNNDTGKG